MEDEEYPWILENQNRTSKTRSLDTLTVTYIDIWQNTTKGQKEERIPESVTNIDTKDILPKTIEQDRR